MRRPNREVVTPTSSTRWGSAQETCLVPATATDGAISTARSSSASAAGAGAESSCSSHSHPPSGTWVPSSASARRTAWPNVGASGAWTTCSGRSAMPGTSATTARTAVGSSRPASTSTVRRGAVDWDASAASVTGR